jgi:hypothetical protein
VKNHCFRTGVFCILLVGLKERGRVYMMRLLMEGTHLFREIVMKFVSLLMWEEMSDNFSPMIIRSLLTSYPILDLMETGAWQLVNAMGYSIMNLCV